MSGVMLMLGTGFEVTRKTLFREADQKNLNVENVTLEIYGDNEKAFQVIGRNWYREGPGVAWTSRDRLHEENTPQRKIHTYVLSYKKKVKLHT